MAQGRRNRLSLEDGEGRREYEEEEVTLPNDDSAAAAAA
jgi:hypothetical protein